MYKVLISLFFFVCFQVLLLLDVTGLSQYRDIFTRETMTGDILLECNEDILKDELGIESKLHRIKLMKLINGHHSAQSYLQGSSNK